jgi:hypothetical protein
MDGARGNPCLPQPCGYLQRSQAKLFDVRPAHRACCRVLVAIVDRLAARIAHCRHDLLPALRVAGKIAAVRMIPMAQFLLRRRRKGPVAFEDHGIFLVVVPPARERFRSIGPCHGS